MTRGRVAERERPDAAPEPPEAGAAEPFKAEARKGRLHREAVSMLREMILSGDLAPGERLRESTFTERFEMSRTPVREAFRTLAAEGLVDLLPNRSVVVSEIDRNASADVFTVLGALEALAAQEACQRMSKEDVALLAFLQNDLERLFEMADRPGYMQVNRRIHELLVMGSKNASLIAAWRLILPRAERPRTFNNLNRARWAEAVAEHHRIYQAVRDRDVAAAKALMEEHFAKGAKNILDKGAPGTP